MLCILWGFCCCCYFPHNKSFGNTFNIPTEKLEKYIQFKRQAESQMTLTGQVNGEKSFFTTCFVLRPGNPQRVSGFWSLQILQTFWIPKAFQW